MDEKEERDFERHNSTHDFKELNVFGRYQKRLFVLLILSSIPNGFSTYQFFAIHHTPDFRCDDPIPRQMRAAALNGQIHNATGSQDSEVCTYLSTALLNFENTTQSEIQSQNNASVLQTCTKFAFDDDDDVTAVTELGMVCDEAWKKPMAVSAYMLGKMAGGVLGGVISDRFGRKTTFLLFSVWQYAATFALSFTNDFTWYTVVMFACGCGGLVNYIACLLLGSETFPSTKRCLMVVGQGFFYGVGCASVAVFAFFLHDWRWYLRVTSLVGVLYVPYFWMLDESPRWLMATGKTERAKKLLKKIAKINGQEALEDIETEKCALTTSNAPSETISMWKTLVLIVSSRRLSLRLVLVGLSWFTIGLIYYVVSLDAASWPGNRYVNIALQGIAEIASAVFFYFVSQKTGRRNIFVAFVGLTALCVAALPFIKTWSHVLVTVVVTSGRLFAAIAFLDVYLHSSELFPTSVRNVVMGFASASARVGSILAPFIIYLSHQNESPATRVILAVFVLLCAATYLVLPETKDCQLPQTIGDAKKMRSDIKIFSRCGGNAKIETLKGCKTNV